MSVTIKFIRNNTSLISDNFFIKFKEHLLPGMNNFQLREVNQSTDIHFELDVYPWIGGAHPDFDQQGGYPGLGRACKFAPYIIRSHKAMLKLPLFSKALSLLVLSPWGQQKRRELEYALSISDDNPQDIHRRLIEIATGQDDRNSIEHRRTFCMDCERNLPGACLSKNREGNR